MLKLKPCLLLIILLFCQTSYANQPLGCPTDLPPIPAGEKAKLISNDFLFLEGPTWSETTNVYYFSEMNFSSTQENGPDAKIYQLKLPNTLAVFIEHSGTNGLLAKGGELFAMNHDSQSVSSYSLTTKQKIIIADNFHGQHFHSPNDMALHTKKHIYFTDPDWQLGDRLPQLDFTGVYWIDPEGKVSLVDKSLDKPNGVVLSLDERTLYVGDAENRVNTYQVSEDGSVSNTRKLFANIQSPDGMTIDCAGNLYITSHAEGSIYLYSAEGTKLDKIEVGPNTTNVEFGGPDMQTLLITTASGLYSIRTNLPGVVR
ncbi:SMP-30/gluconolactonase/LRE family protein [uncultured Paraglaciecola sp.]|uniref:SMP-30/gluconolactonase/LRE family protein n=1 Tax=uncultured Paraglaciecola sp. TaxID=1765024 RepID=UPI0025D40A56|nr:SMP-30/gluconolactonase/LRE family protein [uncultured Paraglaciecola sp.]